MLKIPKTQKRAPTVAHRHAPRQEKLLAERVGGVQVKGSGCGYEKGDVRLKSAVRIEAKCTAKKSFSVTRDMVEKIEQAALGAGEMPVITVDFLEPSGTVSHSLCIMPKWALEMVAGSVEGG